jgi:hypothetical protein
MTETPITASAGSVTTTLLYYRMNLAGTAAAEIYYSVSYPTVSYPIAEEAPPKRRGFSLQNV